MKNKIFVLVFTIALLLGWVPVEAKGSTTVIFTGSDVVEVGDTFTVSLSVKDIENTYDGIVSMGGNLSFDSDMIEYVSSKGIETPYLFQINENYDYKIAGLDFTLENGIRENLVVYTFTFKATKEGTATITLANAKLTDSQDYIDTNVITKKITIKANDIEEKTEVSQEKKSEPKATETKKEEVNSEKNKVEDSKTIIENNSVIANNKMIVEKIERIFDILSKIFK